jgi:hypothetical protein
LVVLLTHAPTPRRLQAAARILSGVVQTHHAGALLLWCHEHEEGEMAETEITFHNKAEIKVQAQIFTGRTLVSTCVTDPGEIRILPAESVRYDIYLKNGVTGWEIARKVDSEAKTLTLSQHEGRYIIT